MGKNCDRFELICDCVMIVDFCPFLYTFDNSVNLGEYPWHPCRTLIQMASSYFFFLLLSRIHFLSLYEGTNTQ